MNRSAAVKRVLFVIVLAFVCVSLRAERPAASGSIPLEQQIEEIATRALSRPSAGISIAVARDGKLIFARGYGYANEEHAVAVGPQTVFHLGSISKYFAAAAALRLVDEGTLRLEEELTKCLPEAPTQGRRVTVKQLLNHTSGMPNFTSLPEAAANERLDLTHAQILALIQDKPFDFEPGSSWRYNNTGFHLAGMLVERVAKQDYGAYLRDRFFIPLGLDTAVLCDDAQTIISNLASGYEVQRAGTLRHAPLMSWKLPFAAGSVCAPATDLVKWEIALEAGQVISAASRTLMRTPTSLPEGVRLDYGLGTRLGSLEGHRIHGHTGSGGGFSNVLESFPDDHLIVAVLTNTESGPALNIATSIARAALGLAAEKPLQDLAVSQAELVALTGNFDSDEGPIEQFVRDGKLRFRPVDAKIDGVPLLRQAENTYAADTLHQIRYQVRDRQAHWGVLYVGGLMIDAKHRVP